jgi:O-antigen ligase/tetratricopeptide (TPR) repeat protein
MPALTSLFLVIALVLAVVLGPQTRSWAWGPAMLALAAAVAVAVPKLWKKSRQTAEFGLAAFGLLVAAWFAWRASISPVRELGQADLMLLGGAVGTFVCIRAIEGNLLGERILMWGTSLLLLANVVVVAIQVTDPSFAPVFRARASQFPSGFYSHYNEAANYLIASSLLVGAAALFSREGVVSRLIWGLIAIAGLVAIRFTLSRGGILGASIGAGVFSAMALIVWQREKSRWFAPALITIPILGLILAGFVFLGWQNSQDARNQAGGVIQMMDNNSRLYLLGIALSCIGLHPMAGGGPRSFSWESFRFFENKLQGDVVTRLPEQVHNELVQSATDYGLMGAGLLAGLLVTLVLLTVIRTLFADHPGESGSADAWRVGGLAALAGMFVQSCFSFVFHLFPGVLLLGISLGYIARSTGKKGKTSQVAGSKILLSAAAVGCLILSLPQGLKGARITSVLWSSYLGKVVASDESKIDALTEAIRINPQAVFYQDRAQLFQTAAAATEGAESHEAAGRAIADYQEAEILHPYNPEPTVNRANLLSGMQRDAEAEAAYERAIQLQGGMEPAFRGHFLLANHLMRKAIRQFSADDPAPTLESMEVAAQQMEQAVEGMHWIIPDMKTPRVSIHESLGAAREANGDYKGAMAAYDFTAKLEGGAGAHYRAGLLNGKMAAAAWAQRRPGEALGYFIEAKRRINQTGVLPQGVGKSQQIEYLAYLDRTINYLKGAKIDPIPVPKN